MEVPRMTIEVLAIFRAISELKKKNIASKINQICRFCSTISQQQ